MNQNIGYIKRAHGIKGALVLKLNEQTFFLGEANDVLFIEKNGQQIPQFIKSIGGNYPELIIELMNVDQITAKQWVGAKVLASETLVEIEETLADIYKDIIAYTFIDSKTDIKGSIKQIEELPQQTILYIDIQGKEALVPLNEDWIVACDDDAKTFLYDCPEGLLEVYLTDNSQDDESE
jgi:16S rRNA processing protein RimM